MFKILCAINIFLNAWRSVWHMHDSFTSRVRACESIFVLSLRTDADP